jgi:2-succinyl-5-enolpyruvyl-6-hydroxy-3-cyclohexene-1-carboxylate synthase
VVENNTVPAENASRAFALVLVDELVALGVSHAVIAPGSRSTPIALALLENPHVTAHVRIDERSAAYLALGIARASGHVVPVVCTSGTATSYFHGAVMEADLARIPLLVLTADRPPELHGIGANQTVEQAGLYGAAVRWAPVVPVPEAREGVVDDWRMLGRTTVDHCLGNAGQPPGPVHLNLPLREPLVPIDDGVGFPYDLDLALDRPESASAAATAAISVPADLGAAVIGVERGVIVAGDLGGEPADSILALAARAGWPIIAEPHSGARRGECAIPCSDPVLRDERLVAELRPDQVLVFGRVGLSRALLGWLERTPHVVITDGGNWDVTRSATQVIHCPTRVIDRLEVARADRSWAASWLQAGGASAAAVNALLDAEPGLPEPVVVREVAAAIPDGGALVVGSSMPIRDLDLVMRPRDGIAIYANRGVSGIDGFVSTAMGIAFGRLVTDGPVVALCGDLSLLHDINGLMPGPDPRPEVTFVVINNDGGGIFSVLPQAKDVDPAIAERLWGTPHGMSIEKLAAAYDVEHTLVRTAADLTAVLSSYGGVRIIEVRTDRAANAKLHERLRQITAGEAG